MSILTGVLFGLAPALKSSRPDLVDALKDAGRTTGTASGGRMRSTLVVVEIALSVVLLMGASLTIRGFLQLNAVNPGFQADRVLLFGVNVQPKHYPTYTQRIAFIQNIVEALRTMPGAQSMAIGNGGMPYAGQRSTSPLRASPKMTRATSPSVWLAPGYAQTLGIPMRAGRDLTPQEIAHAEPFALINAAARKLWPAGADPIGAHVHLDQLDKLPPNLLPASSLSPIVTVVGIVADTRNDGLTNPPAPAHLPSVHPARAQRPHARYPHQHAAHVDPQRRARDASAGIDTDQPLGRPITLEDVLGQESDMPKFNMALFSFFGFLGLPWRPSGFTARSLTPWRAAPMRSAFAWRSAPRARDVLHLMVRMAARLVAIGLAIGLAAVSPSPKFYRAKSSRCPAPTRSRWEE